MSGAGQIRAVVEPAEQLDGPLEGMEAAVAVVTDMHHPSADRAIAIQDVEFPEGEVGLLRPVVGHRGALLGAPRSIDWAGQPRGYMRKSRDSSLVPNR